MFAVIAARIFGCHGNS